VVTDEGALTSNGTQLAASWTGDDPESGILEFHYAVGTTPGGIDVRARFGIMRIPFKVSTTTSNFMIGVTAAASAGIYLTRGYVDPVLAAPVLLGVLLGALTGAKVLARARVPLLRTIFAWVIAALGVEMIVNGWMGRL